MPSAAASSEVLAILEEWVSVAARQALYLPASERLTFVSSYAKARLCSNPLPSVATSTGLTCTSKEGMRSELQALAASISERLSGAQHVSLAALVEALAPPSERSPLQGWLQRKSSFARWSHSFLESDPRHQVLQFFRSGDETGPSGLLHALERSPSGNVKSEYFTVWRPTSLDALRMLMMGQATGKSLNVKGKSAKCGKVSGFVPFVQISREDHKVHARHRLWCQHACCCSSAKLSSTDALRRSPCMCAPRRGHAWEAE